MKISLADSITMSFKVPESEKQIARECLEILSLILNKLSLSNEHLDIIYNPFSKYQSISAEAINKKKGAFNRFKQQVKKNYEEIKTYSAYFVKKISNFDNDSHCSELISAFNDSYKDAENAVEDLLSSLDDLTDQNFRENIIVNIENIKKESAQLEQLIDARIMKYLNEDVLGKNWINDSIEQNKISIEEKEPIINQLSKYRQDILNNVPNQHFRPQALNPIDSHKMSYPDNLKSDIEVAQ